jgi:hypothetical protein
MRSSALRALLFVAVMAFGSSSVASAASLTLAWDPPTDGLTTGYIVVYGTAPGVYTSSVDVGFVMTRRIDGLANSTRYYFRVQAYSAGGVVSDYSSEVSGLTSGTGGGSTGGATTGGSAPAPSGGSSASAGATAQGGTSMVATVRDGRYIDMTWLPLPGVTEYRVEVGTFAGHTAYSAHTPNAFVSFDTQTLPGAQYHARVRGIIGGVPGAPSNEEMVLGTAFHRIGSSTDAAGTCGDAPGAPRQFAAGANGNAVHLSWGPGLGSPAASYVLQVGSAPGLQNLMIVPLPGSQYGLGANASNGIYALRLFATNDCGASLWGAETILNVGGVAAAAASGSAPGAPAGLSQEVSGSLVTLTWAAPAGGGATRYLIEATIPDGTLVASLDTGNPSTSFVHPNTPSGQYIVTVRAGNAAGFGPPSAPVTVNVP